MQKMEIKIFVVVEGNRRLTAIHLLDAPELAKGTSIHGAFVGLGRAHKDAIPKVISCVIAPSKLSARTWIDRKHATGLEGAGTEHWTSIAKARADMDSGISRVELDVVNFVLADPKLDGKLRSQLEGGSFNLSTLQRLVTTQELQFAGGFELKSGKLYSTSGEAWLLSLFTEIVSTIASGNRNGKKFTEREIDSQPKRQSFVSEVVSALPKRKSVKRGWEVSGKPAKALAKSSATNKSPSPTTVSTGAQSNLIPKKFRLVLPSGKINDVFVELKKLDVTDYRHSVSVIFRVFVEFSLDNYLSKKQIQLPIKNGKPDDRLITKLKTVAKYMESNGVMTRKELKPIEVAISDPNSLLAPNTLNAYVHSPWMNPDPMNLKLAWANSELFIERMWQ